MACIPGLARDAQSLRQTHPARKKRECCHHEHGTGPPLCPGGRDEYGCHLQGTPFQTGAWPVPTGVEECEEQTHPLCEPGL